MHKINQRFHDFMDPACFFMAIDGAAPRLEIEQSRAWNLYLGCPMGITMDNPPNPMEPWGPSNREKQKIHGKIPGMI